MSDSYTEANRRLWDEWTGVHEASDFYNLESFKGGTKKDRPCDHAPGVRVRSYEVEEVGDVSGKTLLHLQCHFGIDTLSWARLGAKVTGVDFSGRAIALARSVAAEIGIDATFVLSTVDDLPSNLDGEFDVVYASRGAIWWLQDLDRWAKVAAHFLRPGGVFYVTEFHPVLQTFGDSSEFSIGYPYFPRDEPLSFPVHGSYADPTAKVEADVEFGWPHSIGEIVTAVANAGLRVELLNEMDWVDDGHNPALVRCDDGLWRLPPSVDGELPLMFSLRARAGS